MEKQLQQQFNTQQAPHRNRIYSTDGGFETENARLNTLVNNWWRIFHRLATTPSESRTDMSLVKAVVRDTYSTPQLQDARVTIQDIENGPMIITIPEYNPHHVSFTPRILAGHLDVVKGTKSRPEIDEDIVQSNGPAIDNKGPVAAILATTTYIVNQHIPHPRLRVVLTGDEETDGQHIQQVPIGPEERAFIADKSGPIGTIVLGSGGYTGISAQIEGLSGEKALEFLTHFDRRMGRNMIARRSQIPASLSQVLNGREFSIDTIVVGPNNSRNTVADAGSIQGSVYCADRQDEEDVARNLTQLLSPLGATIALSPGQNESLRTFEITLHGKSGHTSKAGTKEDDGFVSVFSDATSLISNEGADNALQGIIPEDEVRINMGSMSGIRRGQQMDISLLGEARYHNGQDAQMVLRDLQQFVESYGGVMEVVEENGAYHLGSQTASVQELTAVLEQNGYIVTTVDRGFGISDANNAPTQWNTVVFSDGSINPHRSDEAISLQSVLGLLQVFYDLATERKV